METSPVLFPAPQRGSPRFLVMQEVLNSEGDGFRAAQLTAAVAGRQGVC